MAAPMIRGECYLVGPNLWSPGAALLASFDPGTWSAKQMTLATDHLISLVPEIAEQSLFRRHRSLPAATAALADLLSRAVGASWGKSLILPKANGKVRLTIASPRPQLARGLASGINQILQSLPGCDFSSIEDVLRKVLALWETPAEAALLAQAARERKIPVTWPDADQDWLVLGQGIHRQIYHRGYLSSEVGLRDLADDKLASSRLLEKAGLPTTRPNVVLTAEQAVARATALGMPVVLKPNRGWGQVGVWTNLRSPGAIRMAFRRASEQSGPLGGPLLIERHRQGRYLRATLIAGEFRAALTYEAPVMTGDGIRTAEALAREFYRLPLLQRMNVRGRGILEAVLSQQDLIPSSIPECRRSFIVGHDNQGRSIDATGSIHPSLKRLLNRVGRLFAVPLLGVDMIVRDPSAAFDCEHDAIIEVNPAPAFAMHERPSEGIPRNLAGAILNHVVPAGPEAARVPVVAGSSGCGPELEQIAQELRRQGVHSAGYTRNVGWSGTPRGERGRGPLGFSLLPLDAQAEVLFFEVDEVLAGVIGLPVDRVDFLLGNSDARQPLNRMLARLYRPRQQSRWRVQDILQACGHIPSRHRMK